MSELYLVTLLHKTTVFCLLKPFALVVAFHTIYAMHSEII